MDPRSQLTGKCLIDQPVALEPALTFERGRHDMNAEMGFPSGAMSGMPFMPVGFVDHPQVFRRERLGQLSCDGLLHAHRELPLPIN